MCSIISDTRRIAKRMQPWRSPKRQYLSSEVPDSETLRVHALLLADKADRLIDELGATQTRAAELETDSANFAKLLDCRAGKLLLKGKRFVVVAVDEPYFAHVYSIIRDGELANDRWPDQDQQTYLDALNEWRDHCQAADAGVNNLAKLSRQTIPSDIRGAISR